jgi:hypothetical protein
MMAFADGLLSSNHNSTSAGLVGLKDGIEMQDVHCDQIVNKPGDVLSTDVSIKISELGAVQLII